MEKNTRKITPTLLTVTTSNNTKIRTKPSFKVYSLKSALLERTHF